MSAGPPIASVDGRIGDPSAATIPITDDGLLRGDGAFEYVKVYPGGPFRLAAHLDRLERSAATIALPVERERIEAEVESLLESCPGEAGGLRIVLTRGGTRILILEPLKKWGASLKVALIRERPGLILNRVKSLSYAANMQSTRLAVAAGAEEAVWLDPDDLVLEAPTSSIFWATAEGELRTPSLDCPILDSITREVVCEGLEISEGRYEADDLRHAAEAFLASTTREIQPISEIDGAPLPLIDGPRTLEAREHLARTVASETGS